MATVTATTQTTAERAAGPAPLSRRAGRVLGNDSVLGAVGVVVILLGWQLVSAIGLLPKTVVPSMVVVGDALVHLPGSADFWSMLESTLSSWVIGVLITCAIALPIGLLIGSSRFADESSSAVIEFLKPVPPIALIPLGLLLWGPSSTMKLTLIVFGAIWPLLTQVVYGVRDVDQMAVSMARSYHLSRASIVRHVVIPSVSPFVVTGLRLSAAIALIVAIVTEMIGGVPGLGQGIVAAQNSNALATMYALIIVTGLLGLIVNTAFRLLEARMLHWHPSHRIGVAE